MSTLAAISIPTTPVMSNMPVTSVAITGTPTTKVNEVTKPVRPVKAVSIRDLISRLGPDRIKSVFGVVSSICSIVEALHRENMIEGYAKLETALDIANTVALIFKDKSIIDEDMYKRTTDFISNTTAMEQLIHEIIKIAKNARMYDKTGVETVK